LHRQIAGLLALKYAVDITSGAPELVDKMWSVGNQAPASDEVALIVDCGQLMIGRQFDDQLAMIIPEVTGSTRIPPSPMLS